MRPESQKALRFWMLIFAGFALFALAAVSPKYAENVKLQRAIARSEKEIEALQKEFKRLEAIEEALKKDPFYTELMARRELRMAKPGEEEIAVRRREKNRITEGLPEETTFQFYMMFLARHRGLQHFLMAVAFAMICAGLLLFGESEKPPRPQKGPASVHQD